ncbi:MAG: thiamine-phosphate kinase [bacterium]|nr:thiamine-phosphate kinase [bacterium]
MREFDILKGVIAGFPAVPERGVVAGPGDDCAVCNFPGQKQNLLMTVDTMAENIHFRLDWSSPEDIAWKLVASNVSDILAMSGRPWVALLSCQYGRNISDDYINRFFAGLHQAADYFQLIIVGGDTLSGAESSFSLSLLGTTNKPVYRSTAVAGDDIWVTGEIGYSWMGLQSLLAADGGPNKIASLYLNDGLSSDEVTFVLDKARKLHFRPELAQEFIIALDGSDLINSMIDISDGLLQDTGHIARMSNCRIVVDACCIPRVPVKDQHLVASLSGGEDYQLLFSARPDVRTRLEDIAGQVGVRLSRIGTVHPVVEGTAGVELYYRGVVVPVGDCCGYQHQW